MRGRDSAQQPFGFQFVEELDQSCANSIIKSVVYDQKRDISLKQGKLVPFARSTLSSLATLTITEMKEDPESPSPDENIAGSMLLTITGTANASDPPEDPSPDENVASLALLTTTATKATPDEPEDVQDEHTGDYLTWLW